MPGGCFDDNQVLCDIRGAGGLRGGFLVCLHCDAVESYGEILFFCDFICRAE